MGKTLTLPKHKDVIQSSKTKATEKSDPWFRLELNFERYEGAMSFLGFIFVFLFRRNGKKDTWMRTIFVTVMVIISKVSFLKVT